MTNLEYCIFEAERLGEIGIETRDMLLDKLYTEYTDNFLSEETVNIIQSINDIPVYEGLIATKSTIAAAANAASQANKAWLSFVPGRGSFDAVMAAETALANEINKYIFQRALLGLAIGMALNVGIRKFLRARLNNYTKLHPDCIPFSEFKKEPYTIDEIRRKFGDKIKIGNYDGKVMKDNVAVYSRKGKPAFAIVTSTFLAGAMNSHGDSAIATGPKKVELILLDKAYLKYQDFYFANMATKHAIFHPVLTRFLKVAESEWREARKKLKSEMNKIKKDMDSDKKSGQINESAIEDMKMSIYEAEMAGDISLEDRNALLEYLEEKERNC